MRLRWRTRVFRTSGLDAGFLVGGNNKIIGRQSSTVPYSGIEIQHAAGLVGEIRIARKQPKFETAG